MRQRGQKLKLVTTSDLKESVEALPPSEPDPEEKTATEPVQQDIAVKEVCNGSAVVYAVRTSGVKSIICLHCGSKKRRKESV